MYTISAVANVVVRFKITNFSAYARKSIMLQSNDREVVTFGKIKASLV